MLSPILKLSQMTLFLSLCVLNACALSSQSVDDDTSTTGNQYSRSCPLEGLPSDAHQFSSSIHEESLDNWEFFAYSTLLSADAVDVELYDGDFSVAFALEQKESDAEHDLWYRLIDSPIEGLDDGRTSVTFWFMRNGQVVDCSININHFSNVEE